MTALTLYTDGACLGNPGPGGWAAILLDGPQPRWWAGHEGHTTNNRMEIMGVIRGLEQTPPGTAVVVHSDSQYVINTFTKNWQTKANLDLWQRLKRLVAERKVDWQWVRGHNGNTYNEEADHLATAAAADDTWGAERDGRLGAPPQPAAPPPAPAAPALLGRNATTPALHVPLGRNVRIVPAAPPARRGSSGLYTSYRTPTSTLSMRLSWMLSDT